MKKKSPQHHIIVSTLFTARTPKTAKHLKRYPELLCRSAVTDNPNCVSSRLPRMPIFPFDYSVTLHSQLPWETLHFKKIHRAYQIANPPPLRRMHVHQFPNLALDGRSTTMATPTKKMHRKWDQICVYFELEKLFAQHTWIWAGKLETHHLRSKIWPLSHGCWSHTTYPPWQKANYST